MTGTATDARQTADAARHAAGAGELAAGAAADSREAALAAGTAAGAAVLAAGAAVTVAVAAGAARVVLEDERESSSDRSWPVRPQKVSAEANGAAAIAAATAPATTSGFMRFNFANIPIALPLHTCSKHRTKDRWPTMAQTSLDLTGRTAIVTGASRGIGLAIGQTAGRSRRQRGAHRPQAGGRRGGRGASR